MADDVAPTVPPEPAGRSPLASAIAKAQAGGLLGAFHARGRTSPTTPPEPAAAHGRASTAPERSPASPAPAGTSLAPAARAPASPTPRVASLAPDGASSAPSARLVGAGRAVGASATPKFPDDDILPSSPRKLLSLAHPVTVLMALGASRGFAKPRELVAPGALQKLRARMGPGAALKHKALRAPNLSAGSAQAEGPAGAQGLGESN